VSAAIDVSFNSRGRDVRAQRAREEHATRTLTAADVRDFVSSDRRSRDLYHEIDIAKLAGPKAQRARRPEEERAKRGEATREGER